MLHKFLEEGHWFEAKKFGYGAGFPIAWQGWALLGGYVACLAGCMALIGTERPGLIILGIFVIAAVTVPFILIVRRRTRGGWKWRGPGSS